jgi:NitT/TauT family transport system permease protein
MISLAAVIRIAIVVAIIAALEIGCDVGVIPRFTMVPPSQMVTGMWAALSDETLRGQIWMTLFAILVATVFSVVIGTIAGGIIHALPRVRAALDPYLASYYAVPIFVFYPVLIVLFGLNLWPVIAIGFFFAVISMVTNILNGLDRVPRVFLKTATMLNLSWATRSRRIVLPAAFPYFLTGVKFALSYSFVGVIGSEFILASSGLGYQISLAFNNFDNPTMYGLILFVLILVGVINGGLSLWESRVLKRRGLA